MAHRNASFQPIPQRKNLLSSEALPPTSHDDGVDDAGGGGKSSDLSLSMTHQDPAAKLDKDGSQIMAALATESLPFCEGTDDDPRHNQSSDDSLPLQTRNVLFCSTNARLVVEDTTPEAVAVIAPIGSNTNVDVSNNAINDVNKGSKTAIVVATPFSSVEKKHFCRRNWILGLLLLLSIAAAVLTAIIVGVVVGASRRSKASSSALDSSSTSLRSFSPSFVPTIATSPSLFQTSTVSSPVSAMNVAPMPPSIKPSPAPMVRGDGITIIPVNPTTLPTGSGGVVVATTSLSPTVEYSEYAPVETPSPSAATLSPSSNPSPKGGDDTTLRPLTIHAETRPMAPSMKFYSDSINGTVSPAPSLSPSSTSPPTPAVSSVAGTTLIPQTVHIEFVPHAPSAKFLLKMHLMKQAYPLLFQFQHLLNPTSHCQNQQCERGWRSI